MIDRIRLMNPVWLVDWMKAHHVTLWGAADLRGFVTPQDDAEGDFRRALSFALTMKPQIMVSIQDGLNRAYGICSAVCPHGLRVLNEGV